MKPDNPVQIELDKLPVIFRNQLPKNEGFRGYSRISATSSWAPNLLLSQDLHQADKEYFRTFREGLDLLDQLQTSLYPESQQNTSPEVEPNQERELREILKDLQNQLHKEPAEIEVVDLTHKDPTDLNHDQSITQINLA